MNLIEILELDGDDFKRACLKKNKYELNKIFIRLAERGANNLVIWMANEWKLNLDNAMWAACNHCRIETMNILYGLGAKTCVGYFVSSVLKNNVHMVSWLHGLDKANIDEYMKTDWFCLLIIVCKNRQMAMLEWLLNEYNIDKSLLVQYCIHEDVKRFLCSAE